MVEYPLRYYYEYYFIINYVKCSVLLQTFEIVRSINQFQDVIQLTECVMCFVIFCRYTLAKDREPLPIINILVDYF